MGRSTRISWNIGAGAARGAKALGVSIAEAPEVSTRCSARGTAGISPMKDGPFVRADVPGKAGAPSVPSRLGGCGTTVGAISSVRTARMAGGDGRGSGASAEAAVREAEIQFAMRAGPFRAFRRTNSTQSTGGPAFSPWTSLSQPVGGPEGEASSCGGTPIFSAGPAPEGSESTASAHVFSLRAMARVSRSRQRL